MRRLQKELKTKKDGSLIVKDVPMHLEYEEGKKKEAVDFNEIKDISYMSEGHVEETANGQNAPRFENSMERPNQLDLDDEKTITTNKLAETKTEYDEIEQQINMANNSLIQDDFDNESAQTCLPAARGLGKPPRQIETVQAEAEIAQQRYISELARIAKIADSKRIQKLELVEM